MGKLGEEDKGVKSPVDLWLRFWYLKSMSRPLRIEYEGAWYHVMNHARRSDRIFKGVNDYLLFIDLLKDVTQLLSPETPAFIGFLCRRYLSAGCYWQIA